MSSLSKELLHLPSLNNSEWFNIFISIEWVRAHVVGKWSERKVCPSIKSTGPDDCTAVLLSLDIWQIFNQLKICVVRCSICLELIYPRRKKGFRFMKNWYCCDGKWNTIWNLMSLTILLTSWLNFTSWLHTITKYLTSTSWVIFWQVLLINKLCLV